MPIGPAVVLLALVVLLGFLAACHFFQGRRHKDHASRRGPEEWHRQLSERPAAYRESIGLTKSTSTQHWSIPRQNYPIQLVNAYSESTKPRPFEFLNAGWQAECTF